MEGYVFSRLGEVVIPWKPQDLFIYGNDGHWPDGENPADGRLFQNVAATLPATTFGQPVGLAQRLSGTANLQQTTAAARPTTHDETVSGREVWSLRTDGVDDLMASTATFDVNKPWYFAVCATIESDGGVTSHQTPFFGLNGGGNVIRNMIGVRSAGGIRVCALHRSGGASPTSVTDVILGAAFGQPFIVEGWADGANLHCSLNGGPKVSAPYTPGSSPALAPIQLAAGNGIAPTRYYDALAIQRIPSDAERAALRARWAAGYLP